MRKPKGWHVCIKKGWYARYSDVLHIWIRCKKGEPGAIPDINRYVYWRETGQEGEP